MSLEWRNVVRKAFEHLLARWRRNFSIADFDESKAPHICYR
jgi:hypothetical protein